MTTPMRKLIRKMEDMAEIVCNQCITDNGKKPEDDTYAVSTMMTFFHWWSIKTIKLCRVCLMLDLP